MKLTALKVYAGLAGHRVAACLLSLMFLGEASLLVAAIPGFSIQTWQTGNGLIDSAVSSVLQTRDGYIWVGTYNGLARFDGVQFKNYDDNNTPELHDDGISCLFEEGNGTLWIGHSSGELTCYQNGGFTSVEIRAHWNAGPIRNMGTDEAGDLWLLNEEGLLVRLRDGLVLDPQPGLGGRFVGMARSPSGTIWVLRNGRVSQLVRGQLEVLVPDQESRTSF